LNLLFNAKKAPTLNVLSDKLGFDPEILAETVDTHNRAARGEIEDPFERRTDEISEFSGGPYYAMDASVDSSLLPLPTITMGGLAVDESSGMVKNEAGQLIPGLYAAGRTAVGICSNIYVSGLSYADCVFSGRRVARHVSAMNTSESTSGNPV